MNWRTYAALFSLGLAVAGAIASFQSAPGYMDADYYLAGGLQLVEGHGFTEELLWNYLDDPDDLPHPSHAYWMPLASIIVWLGLSAAPFLSAFSAAQLGFLLVYALLPPLTAALAFRLTTRPNLAIISGLLACLPAFYLPFLTTTDTFGVFMLLGVLFFLAANPDFNGPPARRRFLVLGLLAGFLHLARADGILWLGLALLLALIGSLRAPRKIAVNGLLALLGYALVMGPWLARNLLVFGTPLAPGAARSLWLTNYNELFSYPASRLTFDHWLASGFGAILSVRLGALWKNLQTTLAVQGLIFLLPFILVGLWQLHHRREVQLGAIAWAATLFVMTVIFPFTGWRGGFFHSGAALQPLFWAVAPLGLSTTIFWLADHRGWDVERAWRFFAPSCLVLAFGLSSFVFAQRFLGPAGWSAYMEQYSRVEAKLEEIGASPDEIVLVNNPPGYYIASGRPAIVIPYGDESTSLAAARRYGASYLLLDQNHPSGMASLYRNPRDLPGLRYLETLGDIRIFRLDAAVP